MASAFNKEAQTYLDEHANNFPPRIFKKPHSARPLCTNFTTRMDGITDDLEKKCKDAITVLELELEDHDGLGSIPRKAPRSVPEQITCSAGKTVCSDDETETNPINEQRVIVVLNLSESIR